MCVCLEWSVPETKGTRIYKSISLLCGKAIVAFYIVIGYVNCLAKMCIIDEDTLHYTICCLTAIQFTFGEKQNN